jgi:hypothetical protein
VGVIVGLSVVFGATIVVLAFSFGVVVVHCNKVL